MIKNERQYRITRAKAEGFAQALASLDEDAMPEGIHPLFAKVHRSALRSQHDELLEQLRMYEALQEGTMIVVELDSFDDIAKALIQARIAAGLTQKELATRINLKEQQIQRYEASDYATASLDRLNEVVEALGLEVQEEVLLPSAHITTREVFKRLERVGYGKDFVLNRLLPTTLRAEMDSGDEISDDNRLALRAATAASRALGWSPTAFLGSRYPTLNVAAIGTARFKASSAAEERRLSAYAVYAHILALLALEATSHLEQSTPPTDPLKMRTELLECFGAVTFESALQYVWDLGIPVLPLNDPGAFHGACWREGGRNIIILKQQTDSAARWIYDLIHELQHCAENPELAEHAVIETSPISPDRQDSDSEEKAHEFAEEVILGCRSDKLEQACVRLAGGSVERLKWAVPRIAEKEGVEVDSLANHMAFRLSQQDINWWGAANNLQRKDFSPWEHARRVFLQRVDLSLIGEFDRGLLTRAVTDVMEV